MFTKNMNKIQHNTETNNLTFAIITDFGFDFSVASMKALILRSFPDAQIVDVDAHGQARGTWPHCVRPYKLAGL